MCGLGFKIFMPNKYSKETIKLILILSFSSVWFFSVAQSSRHLVRLYEISVCTNIGIQLYMPNTLTDYSGSTKRPGRLTARSRPLSLLILKVRRRLFSLFLILFLLLIFPRIYTTNESFKKSFVPTFNSVRRAVRGSWQVIPLRESWIRSCLLNERYNTTPYHIIEIS